MAHAPKLSEPGVAFAFGLKRSCRGPGISNRVLGYSIITKVYYKYNKEPPKIYSWQLFRILYSRLGLDLNPKTQIANPKPESVEEVYSGFSV